MSLLTVLAINLILGSYGKLCVVFLALQLLRGTFGSCTEEQAQRALMYKCMTIARQNTQANHWAKMLT